MTILEIIDPSAVLEIYSGVAADVVNHAAAADPHPVYQTAVEGNAAYAQRSLNLSDLALASTARTNLGVPTDPAATIAGIRTLGTGALQATAGNDARHSNERVPTPLSVTDAKVAATAGIAQSKISGLVASLAAAKAVVTVFTADGVYTPLGTEVSYDIIVVGPGMGGGSGRQGAAGTVRCGGGAGGSGAITRLTIPASAVSGPVPVKVPAGGLGGAAVTVADTNGSNGAGGAYAVSTAFGDIVKASCGQAGFGGTATSGSAGAGGAYGMFPGAPGGSASTTGLLGANGVNATAAVPGSGAGGGITAADVASAGGYGGYSLITYSFSPPNAYAVGVGGAIGTAGSTGIEAPLNSGIPGVGAGGGGSSIIAAGGDGANGGRYGVGGSGGGASLSGFPSGKGGNGGPGICIVIAHY